MIGLRRYADVSNEFSLSNRFRARRFAWFENLVRSLTSPLKIIDIGGTTEFWEKRGWADRHDVHIVTVNLQAEPKKHANIDPRVGDATDLSEYADRSFDVAFSNSVIEHLFTFEKQAAMAAEVLRISHAYWIQTPNFWFPVEPHFHVPGWQWMPVWLRVAFIRRRTCGWRGPCPDTRAARRVVQEVRLLTRAELRRLFPGATIVPERFCALVKSWIAVYGFPAQHIGVNVRWFD